MKDVSMQDLIDLAYNPSLPAFEVLIPSLVSAYDASNRDPDLREAIELLRGWDYKSSADSVPMSLAPVSYTHLTLPTKRIV